MNDKDITDCLIALFILCIFWKIFIVMMIELAKIIFDQEVNMEEIKVDEIWKDIQDCPNYQVSNLGRVRSIPRPKTKGGILTQRKNNCGYLKVYFWINGKGKLAISMEI